MMYICRDCGEIFDQPEERENYNTYEFWGSVETERYLSAHCPECGSEDFEEACECSECGCGFDRIGEETICPDCAKAYARDVETVCKVMDNKDYYEPVTVELNPIVLAVFSKEEIQKLLFEEALKDFTPEMAEKLALEDGEQWWAEAVSGLLGKEV